MLYRLYVGALLTGARLDDQVWELWDAGVITDGEAEQVWSRLAENDCLGTIQYGISPHL